MRAWISLRDENGDGSEGGMGRVSHQCKTVEASDARAEPTRARLRRLALSKYAPLKHVSLLQFCSFFLLHRLHHVLELRAQIHLETFQRFACLLARSHLLCALCQQEMPLSKAKHFRL